MKPGPRGAQRFTSPGASVRATAARVVDEVLVAGRSLARTLPAHAATLPPRDRALLAELCHGTLRWQPQLDFFRGQLLHRPLKPRDRVLDALLLVGLYQLAHLRTPAYAAVDATVAATQALGRPWASGLINGVLRGFSSRRETLEAALAGDAAASNAHPAWLLERLQADWPDTWEAVVAANNARPPMALRVNLGRTSREAYRRRLAGRDIAAQCAPHAPAALVLDTPQEVGTLPGFGDGEVSVQDAGAQQAAGVLDLVPGLRVLDACAAPGGKTGHVLESEPGLAELVAVDVDAERLGRVRENLRRLGLQAACVQGDAGDPTAWWDARSFHRILVDAPCSGTGVIRRHPDIKSLRRAADIDALAAQQLRLLRALWPLLAPGGILVYVTCSILKQENEGTVTQFLASEPNARERPIEAPWGCARSHGRQILPGEAGMDGFYYACLLKSRAA